jgi:hypothetical protein
VNGAREREDLQTLGLTLAGIPLVWLALGWRPALTVSGHDGLSNLLVAFAELSAAGGDWDRLLYVPALLGGVKLRDTVGPWPVAALLAWLGLSPGAMLNVATFLTQSLIAFLGVRAGSDLARVWRGQDLRPGWPMRAAGVAACAFAPVLGWRIGYGHLTLLAGTLPHLAALALIAAAGAGTVGLVLVALAAAAVATGVLFTGHQMVLYGLVFGGPILLGLWASNGRRGRDLGLAAAVVVGAFLIALPDFYGVLRHALGTDSLRSLRGMDLTYGYLTAHPRDWLGSLLWTRDAIAPWRHVEHHHEVNNPFGPLLLLALALVPWRRARPLALGALASVLMALTFSMDVKPVSDLLLLFPPLGSFRVPTRAMTPALLLLPPLALAGALVHEARGRALATGAAAGLVLALLPSLAREVAAWALAAACLLRVARPARAALFVALAIGGLGAFRERLLPYVDAGALLAKARAIGRTAIHGEPALASPLARVRPAFEWPELICNTGFASGLRTLDGYYFPQRRFVELVRALRWQPYSPHAMLLRFPPDHVSSALLFQLYDVGWVVDEEGAVRRQGDTAGPAWFSGGIARTWRYQDLREELRRPADGLSSEAHRRLWLMADDLHVWRAHLPETLDPACAQATVIAVEAPPQEAAVATARVRTDADCPLTFATNYADNLRATAVVGEKRVPASVFPAYGALAGIWVPAGASEVHVQAVPTRLPLAPLWRLLGVGVLVVAAVTSARSSHPPASPAAG